MCTYLVNFRLNNSHPLLITNERECCFKNNVHVFIRGRFRPRSTTIRPRKISRPYLNIKKTLLYLQVNNVLSYVGLITFDMLGFKLIMI